MDIERAKRLTDILPPQKLSTSQRGYWVLRNPTLNKGLAFTHQEREAFGLSGMLPPRVFTIEEQVELEKERISAKADDFEKYIYLAGLQERNETLFYRVLIDNMFEYMPIVYTPTVGKACQQFSHILRNPRGIWLTPEDKDRIPELLRNATDTDIRLIVVTDNERILGLGDQGAGGMGIPIGKICLYIAGSGIHPSQCLPISLDVGTNNESLLADPCYIGRRERRLRGPEYYEFLEAFVRGVQEVFPHALLQWEDFHANQAFPLLERYRRRILSFNDDIQGTGGVIAAGVFAALRLKQERIADQRFFFMGAGGACTGIATLLASAMRDDGVPEDTIRRSIIMYDIDGLLHSKRAGRPDYNRAFAVEPETLKHYGIKTDEPTPAEIIAHFHPTVMIGATACPGAFSKEMLTEMAAHVERPVVMPLSNPTAKAECIPADALEWTEGRALIASGSPFAPVQYRGKERIIGQANNVFIFPGVGLGAIIAQASEVTDEMFIVAAKALADCVDADRLAAGALYPSQTQLRDASAKIAAAVIRYATANNLGRCIPDHEVEEAVAASVWNPNYVPIVPDPRPAGH
jgi:malic enzyme